MRHLPTPNQGALLAQDRTHGDDVSPGGSFPEDALCGHPSRDKFLATGIFNPPTAAAVAITEKPLVLKPPGRSWADLGALVLRS
jgi:hypothetical protein